MFATSPAETGAFPFPVRLLYERPVERLRVVVDAYPARPGDVAVDVGTDRLRVAIERDGQRYERTIDALPRRRVFDGDRRAVYNNGVLEVTLGTTPRWRAPRSR